MFAVGFLVVALTSFLPCVFLLALAERFSLRHYFVYTGAGVIASIAALALWMLQANPGSLFTRMDFVTLVAFAGGVGGLTYWYVAIKRAGLSGGSGGVLARVF